MRRLEEQARPISGKTKHFYGTAAVAPEHFIAAEANYWTDSQTFG